MLLIYKFLDSTNVNGLECNSTIKSNQVNFISRTKQYSSNINNQNSRLDNILNQNSALKLINEDNKSSMPKIDFNQTTEIYLNKQKENKLENKIIIKNNPNNFNECENFMQENPIGLNNFKKKHKTALVNSNGFFNKNLYSTDNFKKEYISKFKLRRSNTLKLSTWDILLNFISCKLIRKKKIENKIFDQGNKKINYYLDVLTIIKKLQELELINRIIFNVDQQSLINFLSKPLISVFDCNYNNFGSNKNDFYNFEKLVMLEKNINSEDLEVICNSYKNILKSQNRDELNVNLIKIFETKIKYLF